MALNLRQHHAESRRRPSSGQEIFRWVARLALLSGIVYLAAMRGYGIEQWIWIAVAVAWAAALPFVMRGLARSLRRSSLLGWQRRAVLIGVAVLLLAGFALTVRQVLLR